MLTQMHKKIIILGASGMLGGSLFRHFSCCDKYDVLGTVRSENAAHLIKKQGFENIITGIDTYNISTISNLIKEFRPDYLFNCVGIIKQLDAAKNNITSIEINALIPHKLAEICTLNNVKLIHFSTDCVFTGDRGNYKETDIPDATDLYGLTKRMGEVAYDGHLTLRTSIIGHELSSHHSLIDWFLSQKKPVNGYSKAIFSGLPTCYVAEVIEKYVFPNDKLSGLKHLSTSPISKFDLLNIVNSIYGKNIDIIESDNLVIDRSLNSDHFRHETGFSPEPWDLLIEKMNNEYKKYFK
ncbi:dTDP-4-dehydrorhamnose reductase family protein [Yersinia ruckeri]|uniref:dTDP-4-dehydrorhamnose reductase family protein n=2 Tax=Yersinia ruckeri TaxID=29486 RepID=UPI0005EA8C2B|nr:SDR family oxidoreductase [Yersinia ruckeri]AKA39523.1 dTDP-4-dehydrorhamnose reductase [Yersinia ruckeri]MCK8542246.1 SDR family oxidoreductase [Yersinia ruckeri]MCK8551712.1 SDR family oxidoreductase [Yersinia ruckeri]MCW6521889.1 SDR family oxidoreductase [Yersinia ruckeri]MCW6552889.1 SDR family oxidoreductase [Yersinia ruckeri]